MKIMLLYILYCPPTPNMWLQGSFNPWPSYHQSSLPPPLQPHRISAKIGAGCCNHIAFWAWNLNLNSKCNKIWKNEKGMAFLGNILFCLSDVSLQRYDTSKFEKNAFFTKSAAVHNFYIANSPWNLDLNSKSHKIWKNEKGMAFLRNILFCLWDVSLQRYDSANRRPILEKTLFHTVGSCTQWPKQLTCLADGGGWREDQHMWDGQGLKDPCFF